MRSHTLGQTIVPFLAGSLGLAVANPGLLSATTYVPMSDSALADLAALIVEARVVEITPSPDGTRIATDYTIKVERLLKGALDASTIVVRVPGGRQPYGIEARVFGAPSFEPGERALLFLRPTRLSVYAVEQMMLGAFHHVEAGRSAVWMRDLSEAHRLHLAAGTTTVTAEAESPRQAKLFSDWLAARGRGDRLPANYRQAVPSSALRKATDEFRLRAGYGALMRWFAFDENRQVNWASFSGGQPGLPSGGHDEFQVALAAWNSDAETNVQFGYSGQTAANGSFEYYGGPDGLNVVSFEDRELERFDCETGGVVSTSRG